MRPVVFSFRNDRFRIGLLFGDGSSPADERLIDLPNVSVESEWRRLGHGVPTEMNDGYAES